MADEFDKINHFLVSVFHEILRVEEASLRAKSFKNLSMREMHLIEAVHELERNNYNTASSIASAQNITSGTLATAINTLVKKGYVRREQDKIDKRVVRIFTTDKGKEAYEIHRSFHNQMVSAIISAIPPENLTIFVDGLASVQKFFKNQPKVLYE